MTAITYYSVKQPKEKIVLLIQVVSRHFYLKEPIQIIAPDEKSLVFISDLLWKETFLPHSVSSLEPFHDKIFICLPSEAKDSFATVFNLSSDPITSKAKMVYEFEDKTHPAKLEAFQKKFSFYQKLKIPITCGSF